LEEEAEIILAVMGGDGSLGCFIDDLVSDPYISKNLKHLIFVPLPYGTGNDLSRSLGWTNRENMGWARTLEVLANSLVKARRECFNVWDAEIYAQLIEGYAKGGVRVPFETGRENKRRGALSIYRKSLCCYINFSVDSVISNGKELQREIVIEFEPYRTGSRTINNMIYTLLTIKRMALPCCYQFRLSDFIESFSDAQDDDDSDNGVHRHPGAGETIFRTD
jgi:hypothetical protein